MTKDKTVKTPKKLSKKLLLGLVVFSLTIMIIGSIVVGFYYYTSKLSEYEGAAYSFARSASEYIDGDKVLGYLEQKGTDENGDPLYETDEYYDQVMDFLTSSHSQFKKMNGFRYMKYYYVFVPYEDTVTYVWDSKAADEPSMLGDTEEYMDGGKEAVGMIFNKAPEEKITVFKDDTWGYIACAYYPIYNSAGEPVAVAGVDLSMDGMMNSFIQYVMSIFVSILAVTLAAMIVYYYRIKKTLISPIGRLNEATKDLVENLEGKAGFELDIHTGDELEELAKSFGKMNDDLCDYIDKLSAVTAEKERIGAELSIATQIQADMLPRIFPAFPERKDFDIYASMDPAKEVGGDFYDFFLIDEDHIGLVMADVSGKGVPAALFMVIAKTLIKNRALLGESPAEILNNVNKQLCDGNEAELFVTVWLAIVELSTGRGLAANAGHEHPVIRRAGGQYELVKYRHSPAVATMEGLMFREHPFDLYPGDCLFVYTDGVPEATNADEKLFGTDRMLSALNKDTEADPKALLATVHKAIDEYVGDAPQFDDITMLAFSYFGQEDKKMNELNIEATVENLEKVLEFIDVHLEELDCMPKIQMQIDVAVEELFVNIAKYAYNPKTGPATVRIEVENDPLSVVITFIDQGVPYDPLAKADPDVTLSAEERQIGGLGIFMVKKTMDDIDYEYRDGQNILKIKKSINPL